MSDQQWDDIAAETANMSEADANEYLATIERSRGQRTKRAAERARGETSFSVPVGAIQLSLNTTEESAHCSVA